MLVIRKAQMEAFRKTMQYSFAVRMAKHVKLNYPSLVDSLGEDGITRLVNYGMGKCDKYGIEMEVDVTFYIVLMCEYSEDFEETPSMEWARAILENTHFSGSLKIKTIGRYLAIKAENRERSNPQ